ncbi:MAG: peptidoglycan editing factor PgeF [Gammaproteobacteria bacterium]
MSKPEFIIPEWPAPAHVRAAVTTRTGGVSEGDYAGLNLAMHVGDDSQAVTHNRQLVVDQLNLPAEPVWLNQVHGTDVIAVEGPAEPVDADAAITNKSNVVCVVLTADCLPVLFTDSEGRCVAAVHAGWRGLCNGVLENTVAAFNTQGIVAENILTWLGPAIGPEAYEVDEPVRNAFLNVPPDTSQAFSESRPEHWYLDLNAAARIRLSAVGVTRVFGGGFCSFSDERFYSHRRAAPCGRMASAIWLG